MISEDVGWALTEGRLAMTDNAGETWHDLTPIDIFAPELRGAAFLDVTHGWLVGESPPGTLRVYRFRASEWKVSDAEISGTDATLSFADPTHGWMTIAHPDRDRVRGVLRSTDGGETWSPLSGSSAVGSSVHAVSATRAIVEPDQGPLELIEARENGSSGATVMLPSFGRESCPRGPCSVALTKAVSSPVRDEEGWWLLGRNGDAVAVLSSPDGTGWRTRGVVDLEPPTGDGRLPLARAGATTFSVRGGKVVTIDPCCKRTASEGLPSPVVSLSFASARAGWAVAGSPAFLYATDDAGETWRKLEP